ncbi:MAG: hypothetical protein M1823_004901 [Watsoniomyces obsoletus]|nr:MAG: hypothetical protein M1823_004901 [Watsoniomyces obsoletus]
MSMRSSSLTRHVFRRLLLADTNASCRPIPTSHAWRNHRPHRACPTYPQRRNIFGWGRKNSTNPWLKEPDITPGLDKMLSLNHSRGTKDRAPPANELIEAFNVFFEAKRRKHRHIPVQEVQAYHALRTLQHLLETNTSQEWCGLTVSMLRTALHALLPLPRQEKDLSTHNALAKILYEELSKRTNADPNADAVHIAQDKKRYVLMMCMTGDLVEARRFAAENSRDDPNGVGRDLWKRVLKGVIKTEAPEEVERTLETMAGHGIVIDADIYDVITRQYAGRDDLVNMKKWYERGSSRSNSVHRVLLEVCIRNDEFDWGQELCRLLLANNPSKETWDVILHWVGIAGKGVDEVDRLMHLMVEQNPDDPHGWPDIVTINGLLEHAVRRNDGYLAERFVSLGNAWKFLPNRTTFMLQIEHRLNQGDIPGAKLLYDQMYRTIGDHVEEAGDLIILNRLLRELCNSSQRRNITQKDILDVEGDLQQLKVTLEPTTIAALCLFHLPRDELSEVISLLKDHSFHYSLEQRQTIIEAFLGFIKDRRYTTELAWDAYTMVNHVFTDMTRRARIELMNEFFERGRSDMASHVFGNIRQQQHPEYRPNIDAYVACFEGISEAKDLEALEMVHNMLRLDSHVEPDTRLYNSLMLAYIGTGNPERALEFWRDVAESNEGPTWNSLLIVLRACELSPGRSAGDREGGGFEKGKWIWKKIQQWGIHPSRELVAGYVALLTAHGDYREASGFIQELKENWGIDPDGLM